MSEQNILATIDGVNITDADLDAYIANLPKEQQAYAAYYREMEQLKAKLETPVAYRPPRLFQVNVGGTSFQVKVEEHS